MNDDFAWMSMVFVTVVLWALNLTVTRTILTSGLAPLSYAAVRYGLAALIFLALTLVTERTLRILRSDVPAALLAAATIFLNQIAFVYALETTTASTVGLILGATPIFAGLLGLMLGTESPSARFWLGAVVSFAGVGLVALGAGEIEGGLGGIALGVATAATWAAYSVIIAPLMRRYSPFRISALVLSLGSFALSLRLAGFPRIEDLHNSPWQSAVLVLAVWGMAEIARCLRRSWSLYHAGVLLLFYASLIIVALVAFLIFFP